MARSPHSTTTRARHKKWLKRAKGYRGRRHTTFKVAKEAVLTAGRHAYQDRRKKKAVFRAQWHIVINAAVRQHGLSYSHFMAALKKNKIALNRKVLAKLAQESPELFAQIVAKAVNK